MVGLSSISMDGTALASGFTQGALVLLAALPALVFGDAGQNDSSESGIDAALAKVGEFLVVSRAYVMLDEDGGRFIRNTHEWVNRDVGPAIPSWPLHDYKKDIPSLRPLMKELPFLAAHAKDLPPDLRQTLEKQMVDSVLLVPMFRGGVRIGLIGLDSCGTMREWRSEEVTIVQCLAALVPPLLERMEYVELRRRLERVREALGGMSGGVTESSPTAQENGGSDPGISLLDAERRLIIETLARHHGNRGAAAKQLGIAWAALTRRCKKLGIRVARS